jgi:hypothetical protein
MKCSLVSNWFGLFGGLMVAGKEDEEKKGQFRDVGNLSP